jgi:Leucine-rich repeat (LRR) protein
MSVCLKILPGIVILVSALIVSPQTYEDDSLVVRELLDLNGFDTVSVETISSKIGDRIYGLHLSGSGISILPESLGDLDSLQNLQISDNNLTALPQSIGNCTKLRYLSAYDNRIHELPESIGNCTELELLYLIRNRFTRFPMVLLQLKKLLTIDFGGNHLTEVPPEIATYEQPIRLYINDNYLTTLPEAFLSMEPEVIHVAGNMLCDRSEEMEQWLDTYDYYKEDGKWRIYQGCDRQELERTVVQEILDENGLGNLNVERVAESGDLGVETLDLSAENINGQDALPKKRAAATTVLILPSDIDSLKSLKTLDLSGNHLTELPAELHRLYHITSLDISGNNLTALPEYLVSFKNLEQLDVSGNTITSLSEGLEALISDLDPDWKETQQTTRKGTIIAPTGGQRSSRIVLDRMAGSKLFFHLNAAQPARGSFSLYSLDGRRIYSTGMRTFDKNNSIIEVSRNVLAAGTCFAVLTTDHEMSTFNFALSF